MISIFCAEKLLEVQKNQWREEKNTFFGISVIYKHGAELFSGSSWEMGLFEPLLRTREAVDERLTSAALYKYDFIAKEETQPKIANFENLSAFQRHEKLSEVLENTEILPYLKEKDRCRFCLQVYTRGSNLGHHRCSYHPDPGSDPVRHRCCGALKNTGYGFMRGCVPCDHTSQDSLHDFVRWTEQTVFVEIPAVVKGFLHIPDDSVVHREEYPNEPNRTKLKITRVRGIC